jgi:hypothetical protein
MVVPAVTGPMWFATAPWLPAHRSTVPRKFHPIATQFDHPSVTHLTLRWPKHRAGDFDESLHWQRLNPWIRVSYVEQNRDSPVRHDAVYCKPGLRITGVPPCD